MLQAYIALYNKSLKNLVKGFVRSEGMLRDKRITVADAWGGWSKRRQTKKQQSSETSKLVERNQTLGLDHETYRLMQNLIEWRLDA